MAKKPVFNSLDRETFPGQEGWIGPLLSAINSFASQTIKAFDGALTNTENIDAAVHETEFVYTGASVFPIYLPINIKHRPVAVSIVYAELVGTYPPSFATAMFPSWNISNQGGKDTIRINNITGLTASNRYKLRFKIE